MKYAPLFLLAALAAPAQADTLYRCTDKNSESVLYTNHRVPGRQCTILSQDAGGGGASRPAPAPGAPRASATPTPADFPRVSVDTQRERDGNRRTILEQELGNEQRNLDEARKAGNTNKAQLHERNIAALQKEIANLR